LDRHVNSALNRAICAYLESGLPPPPGVREGRPITLAEFEAWLWKDDPEGWATEQKRRLKTRHLFRQMGRAASRAEDEVFAQAITGRAGG
ncbi:MAG TPA: hypothetical protein VMW52_10120, partial [Phycisphaerae bacterium]|nr:hypothetical protein [Phycisphaerae bacterium]